MTNGSLIFNTKIDDTGVNKGTDKISSKMVDLKNKISSTEKEVSRLIKELEKIGKATDKSNVAEKLKEQLSKAKNELRDYKEELNNALSVNTDSTSEEIIDDVDDVTESVMSSSDAISMAIKIVTSILNKLQEVAKATADAMWSATTRIAEGVGYAFEQVGKFTLKQFVGDWEKDSSGLKKLLLTTFSAFSIYKVFDFSKESVSLASDLAEVQNVVDVTFTTMSDKIDEFAQNAMSSYGLSKTVAKKYAGLYGTMATASGISEKTAYEIATTLTGLAGDVASFYNITHDEAYTKLKAVFSGETEVLKDLGIVMTQDVLESYALANGINKSVSEMSQAEKVSLRYKFVLDQLSNAQGDFVRTQNNWANQVRILQLRFESLKATIGQGLINALTPLLGFINVLIEKLQIVADWFGLIMAEIFGDSNQSSGAVLEEFKTSVEETSDALNDVASKSEDSYENIASFDELNILGRDTSLDDSEDNLSDIIDSTIAQTDVIPNATEKAIDNATNKIEELDFTYYLKQAIKSGNWKLVGKMIGNKVTKCLSSIKWNDIKKGVKTLAKNISNFINGAVEGIYWEDVGITIAEGLNTAILFTATMFENVGWYEIGQGIGNGINGFLKNFDAKMYGQMIADRINAIFDFLSSISLNIQWDLLGQKIGETLYSYFSTLDLTENINGNSIPKTIANVLNGVITAGIELFNYTDENGNSVWKVIGESLGQGFQEFIDNFSVQETIEFIKEAINAFVTLVYSAFAQVDFTQLGEDTADGINEWLNDTEWFINMGMMINEIANDILDFCLAVVRKIDVNAINNALTATLGTIDFDGIFNKLMLIATVALYKAITVLINSLPEHIKIGLKPIWENNVKSSIGIVDEDLADEILGINKSLADTETSLSSLRDEANTTDDYVSSMYDSIASSAEDFSIRTEKSLVKNSASLTSESQKWEKVSMATSEEMNKNYSRGFDSIQENAGSMWDNIKSIFTDKVNFSSFITSIGTVFKEAINNLIDGLNTVIKIPFDSLNIALSSLRKWQFAGVEPFAWIPEIGIPQIPKLATGAYVPANYGEFLAVLGDNKREAEIVSPISAMKQAFKEALAEGNIGGGDIHNVIYLDGDPIFNSIVKRNNEEIKRRGYSPLAKNY